MSSCPLCSSDLLVIKQSSAGQEIYCSSCRNVLESATLRFSYSRLDVEQNIESCKGPEGDPRPGYKGPGHRAKCHLYSPGNKEEEENAKKKARASSYSSERAAHVQRLVTATPYFTGAPQVTAPGVAPTTGAPAPASPTAPVPTAAPNLIGQTPATMGVADQQAKSLGNMTGVAQTNVLDGKNNSQGVMGGLEIGEDGVAPLSDLNGPGTMLNAVTGRRRLLALYQDLESNQVSLPQSGLLGEMDQLLGPRMCTAHGDIGCSCIGTN